MGEWIYRFTFSLPQYWLEESGQLQALAALTWGKSPQYHWIGGWVGPRAGLDSVEKRKFVTQTGVKL
jgi:hypothetical protein